MTTEITEGNGKLKITFEFADRWQVYKYDEPIEENFFHKYRVLNLKAVDCISSSDKCLLLMEVKHVLASDETSKIRFVSNLTFLM